MPPCYNTHNLHIRIKRLSNAATPKPGRFDEEWTGSGLAPMKMRGRTELPEASLILTSVKPELKE